MKMPEFDLQSLTFTYSNHHVISVLEFNVWRTRVIEEVTEIEIRV